MKGAVDLGNPSASLRAGSLPFFSRLRAGLGFGGRVGVRAGGGPFDPSTGLRTGPSTSGPFDWAQDRWLFGALAESSVHEDSGGLHAVVGGGVFADALSDIVEHVDDFARAVGLFEDGVGEIERRVG